MTMIIYDNDYDYHDYDDDNEDLENLGPLQALVTSGSDVLISKNNCSKRIFHK